jgi:hypothetical protein
VFELDGAADERPRACEAAGLFMLANIDVLIAIWDGEVAAGVGGTAQIVERAIADGIVVVWIEPSHPNAIRISRSGAGASAGLKSTFRPADVATVAGVAEKIFTSPTQ